MIGVDTNRHIARVADKQARRDRATMVLIGNTMNHLLPAVGFNPAVSPLILNADTVP